LNSVNATRLANELQGAGMDEPTLHWGHRVRKFLRLDRLPRAVQKVVVALLGGTVLLAGLVMIVTPGPAIIVIPLGILLLGTEFAWAEKLGAKILAGLAWARDKWRAWRQRRALASRR
jgi:hypothetical protein